MAKLGNRVKETSATTGTGTLDLAGAPTGFRGFGDEFTSGDEVYYLLVDDPDNPTDYEYGIGTFTSGTPDTLSRDTVEGSSNSGSKVSWTAGCTVVATPTAAALPLLTAINSFTKIQKWAKGADVASAAALTLGNDGNYFDITGTTAITSIVAKGIGTVVKLHFDGALTLTHHSTDLVLPGAANITTVAGDEAEFVEYASGDWRCTNYLTTAAIQSEMESGTDTTRAVTPGRMKYHPGVAKAWASWDSAGSLAASYNVSSITDTGVGNQQVNFTIVFSSSAYAVIATANAAGFIYSGTKTSSACQIVMRNVADSAFADLQPAHVAFFGDQ